MEGPMATNIARRKFIATLGGAAAWPLAARAQQPNYTRRIGVLMDLAAGDPEGEALFAAFQQTLQQLGWSNGRNIQLIARWPGADLDQINAYVAELVSLQPDVIVVMGNFMLHGLQQLTKTIPVVFTSVSGPVESGFVISLARPGVNITGFQNYEATFAGKLVGLLKEAAPNVNRVAVLLNPDTAVHVALLHAAEAAAPALGIQVTAIGVHDRAQIEPGIAAFAENADGSLVVLPHPITIQNRQLIIEQAARHRLPAIYFWRYYAADGGLMSYGADESNQLRLAAGYVDRILKGEKAGELPVQAPTKLVLVINLKTAKTLGLALSPGLLSIADEVID